jgi:hypothetical protein
MSIDQRTARGLVVCDVAAACMGARDDRAAAMKLVQPKGRVPTTSSGIARAAGCLSWASSPLIYTENTPPGLSSLVPPACQRLDASFVDAWGTSGPASTALVTTGRVTVVSGLDASEQGHPPACTMLMEAVDVAAVKAIPKGARTA